MRVPGLVRLTAAVQVFLLLAALLLPGLAAAATIQTDLWVYQNGDTVTVTGAGFAPSEVVDLVTTDPLGALIDSGATNSDDAGNISYAFVLNATVDGIYDVSATGETSGYTATTEFDPGSITYTDLGGTPVVRRTGQSITFAGTFTCQNSTPNPKCTSVTGITVGIYMSNGGSGVDTSAGNLVASFAPTTPASFPLAAPQSSVAWTVTKTIGSTLILPDAGYEVGVTMSYLDATNSAATATATNTNPGGDEFIVDTTAPAAPTLTGTSPSSPSTSNTPKIIGSAEAASTVNLYTNNTCTSTIVGTGTAAAFASPGLGVTVASNSTSTFWATATDAAGNVSPCSTTSVTYVEDSIAPNPPNLTSSTPPSPAMGNPSINGTAEAGATVKLYKQSDCGGGVQATGTAAGGSFSIGVSVGTNSSTDFYGTATDAAGNTSTCSTTHVLYVRDNTGPIVTILTSPTNPTTSTDAGFTFSASDSGAAASGVNHIECQLDGGGFSTCISPYHSTVTPGSHTFQARAIDNAGNTGTPASYTWTVSPADSTAPVVTVTTDATDTVASSGWYNIATSGTDGVLVHVSASDSSGVTNLTCTDNGSTQVLDVAASNGSFTLTDGTHSISCVATDGTSNTGASAGSSSMPISYKVDEIAPSLSLGHTADGSHGWNVTDPAAESLTATDATSGIDSSTFDCSDSLSGFGSVTGSSSPYSANIGGQGIHDLACTVQDAAGNTSSSATDTMKIDSIAPSLSLGHMADGSHGWNVTDPAAESLTATDATSGIDSSTFDCSDSLSGFGSVTGSSSPYSANIGGQGIHDLACTVQDAAGNTSSSATDTMKIDSIDPTIAITTPVDGAQYTLNQAVNVGYTCADATSGIATCIGDVANGAALDSSTVGLHTFTVNASDEAGNTSSVTYHYTVTYDFIGFLAPINNPTTVNTGKSGRTYPVKWQLTDANGAYISDVHAIKSITYVQVNLNCFADADGSSAIETLATGGTVLRYDATANQFVYNWATPSGAHAYVLYVTLDDGTAHEAWFNLSK